MNYTHTHTRKKREKKLIYRIWIVIKLRFLSTYKLLDKKNYIYIFKSKNFIKKNLQFGEAT